MSLTPIAAFLDDKDSDMRETVANGDMSAHLVFLRTLLSYRLLAHASTDNSVIAKKLQDIVQITYTLSGRLTNKDLLGFFADLAKAIVDKLSPRTAVMKQREENADDAKRYSSAVCIVWRSFLDKSNDVLASLMEANENNSILLAMKKKIDDEMMLTDEKLKRQAPKVNIF